MNRLLTALAIAALGLLMGACEDEVSDIGSSLVSGEVTIVVDSIPVNLNAVSEWQDNFDSRATTKLLGRLRVPEYGSLSCSFVSQLMCSTGLLIPDSIPRSDVDSLNMHLYVYRGNITGDSLAPQQLKIYRLTKQLPSGISSDFNPEGYYNPSEPLGVKSYTITNIAKLDTASQNAAYVNIKVPLPKSLALDLFDRYRANDPIFAWPQTFAKWFPGVYVEQNFGNGCVANVSYMQGYIYWHHKAPERYRDENNEWQTRIVDVRDSLCILASQPEVLSSNNISYVPAESLKAMVADKKAIITSPGGYILNITFPLKRLVEQYYKAGTELSVVSGLGMDIPAKAVKNDYGIKPAPYLLMVRKSEREAFFRENKIPDGINSFYASYDSENATYKFRSMRNYFLNVLQELRDNKTEPKDDEFVLIPVNVTTEDVTNYNGTVTTYVLRVAPYLAAPSMTVLDTENAKVYFTFSSQVLM